MKKMLGYVLCIVLFGYSIHRLKTAEKIDESQASPTNALLIFLDDSETSFRAITDAFLAAFMQEAGPIIVSASVIANIREAKIPDEKDPLKLAIKAVEIRLKRTAEVTPEEQEALKGIIASAIAFDENIENKWVIKEINSSLYLLLPNNYLKDKQISVDDVKKFSSQGSLTPTEQKFGLKVNHMKTATPDAVKRPLPAPEFADYFANVLASIFITNSEYAKEKNKSIPSWSIRIDGHGMINNRICGISIAQFKDFIDFLEKIKTRLLVYSSCYAAGVNADLMYKDAKTKITKTYPFAIITEALTDAVTYGRSISTKIVQEKLVVHSENNFKGFVQAITMPDIINYSDAIKVLSIPKEIGATPQIKLPGIEWFSILDYETVTSIGSIKAKTRTEPLVIAAANSRGILLYGEHMPFELIIKTKTVPTFVSMIPGDAVHVIKKISSPFNTADAILNSFYIKTLKPHKVFVIDEIKAPFSETMSKILTNNIEKEGSLVNVVLEIGDATFTSGNLKGLFNVYFMYKGQVYQAKELLDGKNPIKIDSEDKKQKYMALLKQYGKQIKHNEPEKQVVVTTQLMQDIKTRAIKELTKQPSSGWNSYQNIVDVLKLMPNNTALRIPKFAISDGALQLVENHDRDIVDNVRKILWIENTSNEKNLIIDISPKVTRIYYKDPVNRKTVWTSTSKSYNLTSEDYVPNYQELFDYFDSHLTLNMSPKDSIQDLLTPEAIAKIKAAQEKKIADTPIKPETPDTPEQASKKAEIAALRKPITNLETKAKETFAQEMTPEDAKKKIIELLNAMPNNTALHLPKISFLPLKDPILLFTLLVDLTKYQSKDLHKILWIDTFDEEGKAPIFTDIIIDITPGKTQIFQKTNGKQKSLTSEDTKIDLEKNYVPLYKKIFDYFDKHMTLDKSVAPQQQSPITPPQSPQPPKDTEDVLYKKLLSAIKKGDKQEVEALTQGRFDPTIMEKSKEENSLLHWAAYWGNPGIVSYLLDKGKAFYQLPTNKRGINAQNEKGQTALHMAVLTSPLTKNHEEVVRLLLTHKINVGFLTTNGRKAIDLVKKDKNPEIYALLKETEKKLYKDMMDAVKKPDMKNLEYLTKARFGVNIVDESSDGNSALHWAAYQGNTDIVNYLLSIDSDINKQNEKGQTALHMTVLTSPLTKNHEEVVRLLLTHKINVGFLTTNSRKAIDLVKKDKNPEIYALLKETEKKLYKDMIDAVKKQDLKTLEHLTKARFGVNIVDESGDGNSALHWAAYRGNTDIVNYLLGIGSDSNKKNKLGQTPLHMVLLANPFTVSHIEVLKLLVARGADVTIKTAKGVKAIDLVQKAKYPSLYQLLEKAEPLAKK